MRKGELVDGGVIEAAVGLRVVRRRRLTLPGARVFVGGRGQWRFPQSGARVDFKPDYSKADPGPASVYYHFIDHLPKSITTPWGLDHLLRGATTP